MNTILALVSLFVVASLLLSWVASRPRGRQFTPLCNTNPNNSGTFEGGRKTFLADAAITTRYKLVKKGTDADHIAIPTATADEPIGVLIDEPSAAEQPATVELLGAGTRTVPVIAGGTITDGADLYMNNAGAVTVKPTAAGTYWKVGTALGGWLIGEQFTMIPCKPRKLIVLAALTNTTGDIADTPSTAVNPTKADFDSLLVAAGKLQADFLLLAAALKTGADIDYATT